MPDNNVNPENIEGALEGAEQAAADAYGAAQAGAEAAGGDAHAALDNLANTLAGQNENAFLAPEGSQPVYVDPDDSDLPDTEYAAAMPVQQTQPVPPQGVQPFSNPYMPADATRASQPAGQAYEQAYEQAQQQYQQQGQAPYGQPYAQGQQPYQQPYQQNYQQPMPPQYGASSTDPGTTPLVLGILAVVAALVFGFTFIGPIVGIILGAIGISKGSKVLRADPNNGRAKGGKITGIIGIVLSVLALLATIAFIVVVGSATMSALDDPDAIIEKLEQYAEEDETGQMQEAIDELKEELNQFNGTGGTDGSGTGGTNGSGTPSTNGAGTDTDNTQNGGQTGSESAPDTASSDSTEAAPGFVLPTPAATPAVGFSFPATGDDRGDARALGELVLSSIKNPDADQKAAMEAYLDDAFKTFRGATLEELGISKQEYMDWAVGKFQYTVQGATATESFGWADATVEIRNATQFSYAYEDALSAIPADQLSKITSEEDYLKLTGKLFKNAMDKTDKVEANISINMNKVYFIVPFTKL